MAINRKQISKRVRFEVFKRDSFKCQYCGVSAPDVVLHVDHIQPVSKNGTSDITNLITACLGCNLGKGARPISDDSAAKKSKAQLDSLQERKEQLEMMAAWSRGLLDLEEQSVDRAVELWSMLIHPWMLQETGRDNMRKHIKRFGLGEVLESIRIAVSTYGKRDTSDKYTFESLIEALHKIPGICYVRQQVRDKPHLKELYSIRAVLRYHLRGYFDARRSFEFLEAAVKNGVSTLEMREALSTVKTWKEFEGCIQGLVSKRERS